MPHYHPHPDEKGRPVLLEQPHTPTAVAAWTDPGQVATVVPGGELPPTLNGIAFAPWHDVPTTVEGWNAVAGQCVHDEPPFAVPAGKQPAAGVVIEEADGRIWLVSPSNAFGGYTNTFPKGRIDGGVNLQACAIREAWEEAGLQVRITGWLADSTRSRSHTRYYRGVRVGGSPADMGWETQAVHLVPQAALDGFLVHPNDVPLRQALRRLPLG